MHLPGRSPAGGARAGAAHRRRGQGRPWAAGVSPIAALERVMHLLDRSHEGGFRSKAFFGALLTAREVGDDELRRRAEAKTLTELPGIGKSSAQVIEEALAGKTPAYLAKLEK